MRAYNHICENTLRFGTLRPNRTGVRTTAVFGESYRISLRKGFPLLTTKQVSWKNIVLENLWFLSGDPTVAFLHKHGARFWDPWVGPTGEIPMSYGEQWRHFGGHGGDDFDQITYLDYLLRTDPWSRRMIVSAWDPRRARDASLPPCHMLWGLSVQPGPQGKKLLHCHLTQRSCDLALGLPYNVAGYAFLTHLFAHIHGMLPGIFHHAIIDSHVYAGYEDGDQYDHRPALREQITRPLREPPRLKIDRSIRSLADVGALTRDGTTEQILAAFRLEGYDPHPAVKYAVVV